MKFFIVFAVALTVAAAFPDQGAANGIIGNTAQGAVDGANNAVDATSNTLTDGVNDAKGVVAGVAGPTGIAGGALNGGASDAIAQIVSTVDQDTGLQLGCLLQQVLGK